MCIRDSLNDFLDGLGRTRRTLSNLPDATDNIAKLAQAWADGEVDLSPNTSAPKPSRKRDALRPIAYAGIGAAIALGASWAAAQL